jgi:hypothetical protein
MDRARAIVTPHLIEAAEFGPMQAVLADVLTTDPQFPSKIQALHHRFALALVAHLSHWGGLEPAHVRLLNLLREMLSVSDLKPLELWPGWKPAADKTGT